MNKREVNLYTVADLMRRIFVVFSFCLWNSRENRSHLPFTKNGKFNDPRCGGGVLWCRFLTDNKTTLGYFVLGCDNL